VRGRGKPKLDYDHYVYECDTMFGLVWLFGF